MGPHPKPRQRNSKAARKALTEGLKALAKKKDAHAKLKAEMAKPKPKVLLKPRGTHFHEPEGPSRLSPEAKWIKDNGWSRN
jgi:hypothetical protein